VYPVYQSRLGRRLQIPVEVLINHTEKIDQTRVLTAEDQSVAKMAALFDRPDTLPGERTSAKCRRSSTLGKVSTSRLWLESCREEAGSMVPIRTSYRRENEHQEHPNDQVSRTRCGGDAANRLRPACSETAF
jgi:hypothetical protein